MKEKGEHLSDCGCEVAGMMADTERGEDVREDCIKLYRQAEELGTADAIRRGAFQLMLPLKMGRFALPPLGDPETIPRDMLRLLKENIDGGRGYRPARTMLPVNTLIWFYRRRPEMEQCLKLKQVLTDRGYLFAGDVNNGKLPVVNVLRDSNGRMNDPRQCQVNLKKFHHHHTPTFAYISRCSLRSRPLDNCREHLTAVLPRTLGEELHIVLHRGPEHLPAQFVRRIVFEVSF